MFSTSPLFYQREYLDHDELARDVIRARVFYYQRGYREATVDTVVRPAGKNAVRVIFAVREGAPLIVSDVRVTQTTPVLNQHDVSSLLTVRIGKPFNVFELDSTRVHLRERLWDKGFANAIVDTVVSIDTAAHRAVLTLAITPRWIARVASVDVQGNQHVATRTILKSLLFQPGDVYRRSTALESQRLLYESNLFRSASITVPRGQDSLKHVVVAVREAPPRSVQLSGGFNTVDFVQVEGRYSDYDWYGGARQLNTTLTLGNLFARQLNGRGIFYDVSKTTIGAGNGEYYLPTFNASADVRQPWFGSPHNSIALGLFSRRQIAPGVYVDRDYGANATFTRLLTLRGPASLDYRFEVTAVSAGDVYFCVSYGVCDVPTLSALRKNQKLSPLTLSTSVDQADNPYEPRRGYRARVDAEHASAYTLSDFRYNRISSDEAGFLPLGKRSVLAAHLRLGYVNALASTAQALGVGSIDTLGIGETDHILHPRKRFYLGGASSVRGFAEEQLGPRVLTIAPQTLRGNPSGASSASCPATVAIVQCDPNAAYIKTKDFDPRPLGGNELVEGSVEFRFPIPIPLLSNVLGALFVDGGYLAQNTNPTLAKSQAALTPGFGVRYLSPAGPIRVDVGINPITTEKLPVVTQDVVNGQLTLVTLATRRTYTPATGVLSRLTLHLAIGEAY